MLPTPETLVNWGGGGGTLPFLKQTLINYKRNAFLALASYHKEQPIS